MIIIKRFGGIWHGNCWLYKDTGLILNNFYIYAICSCLISRCRHLTYKLSFVVFQAKEIYHTRCLELERLKRENASPKDIEKVNMICLCSRFYTPDSLKYFHERPL